MKEKEISKLYNSITNVDDKYIEEVRTKAKKKRNGWLKWGTMAACLCLVIAGAAIWSNGTGPSGNTAEKGSGDTGGDIDGVWSEGIDPVVASVAIFPAEESLSDVVDATAVSISEEDAKSIERLGAYLPDTLPEDCRYGTGGYYETTMKDGTQYHMIRVTYESGQGAVPAPVQENAQSASEMTGDTAFLWMVWGHRPDTDRPVYQPDEVTPQILDRNGGVFYIDYGGIYVGISQMDISTDALMAVIDSIG